MNLGKEAEKIICNFLKTKNFNIISTNWWLKKIGEIDIIALKNNCYYFIEVKALSDNRVFDPSVNYGFKKRRRFHQLVNYYVNKNKIKNFITCLATVIKKDKKFVIKIFKNV